MDIGLNASALPPASVPWCVRCQRAVEALVRRDDVHSTTFTVRCHGSEEAVHIRRYFLNWQAPLFCASDVFAMRAGQSFPPAAFGDRHE